jgi:hypothetical protein
MALIRACPAGRTPATALSAIALRTRADEGSSPHLGQRIGRLDPETLSAVDAALRFVLAV